MGNMRILIRDRSLLQNGDLYQILFDRRRSHELRKLVNEYKVVFDTDTGKQIYDGPKVNSSERAARTIAV
jgi:hypothetical protein